MDSVVTLLEERLDPVELVSIRLDASLSSGYWKGKTRKIVRPPIFLLFSTAHNFRMAALALTEQLLDQARSSLNVLESLDGSADRAPSVHLTYVGTHGLVCDTSGPYFGCYSLVVTCERMHYVSDRGTTNAI